MSVLVVAAMVSFIDRQVLAIVVDPMKEDVGLTDTDISWLYSGYAIFYALAGFPLARLADTRNRKWLIAAGVFAWSVMTIATGLTRHYTLILLARIGVGVGEAVLQPAANSLAGDLFPRHRIPLALSVFQTGVIVGSALAFIVGGVVLSFMQGLSDNTFPLIGQLHPWQLTFLVVGLPGFVVLLLLAPLREPARRTAGGRHAHRQNRVPLTEVVAFYRTQWKTMIFHHFGFLSLALAGTAAFFWTVSFFTRVHGVSPANAAQGFGWILLIFGSLGTIWAGVMVSWLARRGRKDAAIIVGIMGGATTIPIMFVIQLMPTPFWAFVMYAPAMFFVNAPFGVVYGALPLITPTTIRAQVASIYMLVSACGTAFGPVIAALCNDHLFPGQDGVRYSLMTVTSVFGLIGVTLLCLGRKHYARSLVDAEAAENATAAP